MLKGARMRQIQATAVKGEPPEGPAEQNWRRAAARWRLITYLAAVLPLLVIVVLVRVYPDLNRPEIPDWRPLIALAEASWKKEDLYQARHLYLQASRLASWRRDWYGLVAAGCGIYRLDGLDGPYSKAFAILTRAAMTAEVRQSPRGIATVATAFAVIGADKAAAAALTRIQPHWPAETNESDDVHSLDACRTPAPKRRVSE